MHQSRAVFAFGFLICSIAIITAIVYFQSILGLEPCPLCDIQRYLFITLGSIYLLATLHNPQGLSRFFYSFFTTLTALAGACVSAWHVHLQNLPAELTRECGPDLSTLLETLPLNKLVEEIFTNSGGCIEASWTLLGLGIPAWTFFAFIGLMIYGFWILVSRR